MDKNKIIDGFIFVQAPGSTEMYLIPPHSHDEYFKWCECELFDEKWGYYQKLLAQHEIIFKNEIRKVEIVIAHIVSCPILLGERRIAFGSIKEMANYIGRESEDVIFGERENIKPKDVKWEIEIASMKVEDFEKLKPYV